MKKRMPKKLTLSRETLINLEESNENLFFLKAAAGGGTGIPGCSGGKACTDTACSSCCQ